MKSKVVLVYFSSSFLVSSQQNLEWETEELKQQTSCSSVTAQADRRGIVYSLEVGAAKVKRVIMIPLGFLAAKVERVIMIPLGFSLFILPSSYFWLYPVQNRTWTHHQLRKRMKMNIIMLLVVSTCD